MCPVWNLGGRSTSRSAVDFFSKMVTHGSPSHHPDTCADHALSGLLDVNAAGHTKTSQARLPGIGGNYTEGHATAVCVSPSGSRGAREFSQHTVRNRKNLGSNLQIPTAERFNPCEGRRRELELTDLHDGNSMQWPKPQDAVLWVASECTQN